MLGTPDDQATKVKAILLLCLAVTLFAIMDGLSKLLAHGYPVGQLVWARYAFAVPVVLLGVRPAAWSGLLRSQRPALQAVRGLLPVLANLTAVTGLGLMPLGDATAISFLSPILVVALAAPLLGERITMQGWIGVACGFAGILIIVRPGTGVIAGAAVFPLATAVIFALYQVVTRLVTQDDSPLVTLAWTIMVGLFTTTPLLVGVWRSVDGRDWLLLVLSGVLFGLGQLLLIRAFAKAPAALLAPFSYLQIVVAILFGVIVFGHLPDIWSVVGTSVIIFAGLYVLRSQGG